MFIDKTMTNNNTRKMLLEDFWEDIDLDMRDEGSFDKEEIERAHQSGLERTQHNYKYYIIIKTVWKKCYEESVRIQSNVNKLTFD